MKKEISKKWTVVLIFLFFALASSGIGIYYLWQINQTKTESYLTNPEKKSEENKVKEQKNLVALGDSLTNAYNLSSEMTGDHSDYSFATGTQVNSFYL